MKFYSVNKPGGIFPKCTAVLHRQYGEVSPPSVNASGSQSFLTCDPFNETILVMNSASRPPPKAMDWQKNKQVKIHNIKVSKE